MLAHSVYCGIKFLLVGVVCAFMTQPAGAMNPGNDAPTLTERHFREPEQKTSQTVFGAPVYRKTFVSPLYKIDGIYRSMKGPTAHDLIALADSAQKGNQLLWITSQYTEIVSGNPATATSPEFMCHSNIGMVRSKRHEKIFKSLPGVRLFTLSQGQMDVRFPEGFGIPVMSQQPMELQTQVLNLNEQPEDLEVRHRVTVEYVRQADLKTPMKPLRVLSAQGMVATDASALHYGLSEANPEEHGPGCSVGQAAGKRRILDSEGNNFVAHWVVKPGRDENRTLVTNWMKVPFDTTVHFIAVHLHPFAESATLTDLTLETDVFHSRARGPENQIGLTNVESFVSETGVPIFQGHEYELKSIYENTTGENQDSMAVMFLYVLDKEFRLPPVLAVK